LFYGDGEFDGWGDYWGAAEYHRSPTQTGMQRYTPTFIPLNPGAGTRSGGSSIGTSSASKTVAATEGVKVVGRILAAGLGVMILL
jgi:hypothetical protein